MTGILERLRADHRSFRELIEPMEAQVRRCRRAEDIDLELIQAIVSDATEYSNQLHHPVEDQLFALLRSREGSVERVIDRLEEEHRRLAVTAEQLTAMLDGVLRDEPARRDRLVTLCTDYLDLFARHLDLEESEVFTRAERVLGDADWRLLEGWLEARTAAQTEGDEPSPAVGRPSASLT